MKNLKKWDIKANGTLINHKVIITMLYFTRILNKGLKR